MDTLSRTYYPPVPSTSYRTNPPNYAGYFPEATVVQQNNATVSSIPFTGERSYPLIGFGITLTVFSLIANIISLISVYFCEDLRFQAFPLSANICFLFKGIQSISGGYDLRAREQTNNKSILIWIYAFVMAAVTIVAGPIFIIEDECHKGSSRATYVVTFINGLSGLVYLIFHALIVHLAKSEPSTEILKLRPP